MTKSFNETQQKLMDAMITVCECTDELSWDQMKDIIEYRTGLVNDLEYLEDLYLRFCPPVAILRQLINNSCEKIYNNNIWGKVDDR